MEVGQGGVRVRVYRLGLGSGLRFGGLSRIWQHLKFRVQYLLGLKGWNFDLPFGAKWSARLETFLDSANSGTSKLPEIVQHVP